MAYSSFPRLGLLLGVAAGLLGGCCANNVCDCDDANADAIKLRFSTTAAGPTGQTFAAADLDTLIIQRSPRPYRVANKFETVTLYRTAAQAGDSIMLNNGTPFSQVGSTKLSGYRYVVQYLAHPASAPGRKGVPTAVAVIDSVALGGALVGTGCCTCYTNTRKAVHLNGSATPQDLRTDNQRTDNQLVLTKP